MRGADLGIGAACGAANVLVGVFFPAAWVACLAAAVGWSLWNDRRVMGGVAGGDAPAPREKGPAPRGNGGGRRPRAPGGG